MKPGLLLTFLPLSLHSKLQAGEITPVILASEEAEIRRIKVQGQPQANSCPDPISKKPFTNRAQVIRRLPSKPGAMNSNPSTIKNK
jgi:hypothetical protein